MNVHYLADGLVPDRLPQPDWLQRHFKPTDLSLAVNGQPMKIYECHVRSSESLTLGSNTENHQLKSCNKYIVFLKRAVPAIQASH